LNLTERYSQEVGARGFEFDPAQLAASERLDALRTRVLADEAGGRWRRLWRRWRARGSADGPRGLYLYGGVGRGKTWLMDLFYDSLPPRLAQRRHFHQFMREVQQQLRTLRRQQAPLELLARRLARKARVLCLDELFVSDIADAMILGGLFEALLRTGVVLVITSNSAPLELYPGGLQRERFLPAIALLETLEQVALDGPIDYRLRQLQRRPIYLDSAAADTPAQLAELFTRLAGEPGESGATLRIHGRTLRALRRARELVWFSFAALCEGPRSHEDYAEIAAEFHTVLISDVPIFASAAQDNAARRFIALVDEFYDRGVKLALSAAAPPAQLYRAERLQFDFRRTASRLVEMQTEAYLARARRE
jgi:cell division protein ZapE